MVIKTCTKCSLVEGNKYNLITYGNPNAKLYIVRSYATSGECNSGKFLNNKQNKYLVNALLEIGLTEKDYYITSVVQCYPKNSIRIENIDICTINLKKLLQDRSRVILSLGKLAYSFLTGNSINIPMNTIVGKTVIVGTHTVIVNYSIGYILHNKEIENEFYINLRKFEYESKR